MSSNSNNIFNAVSIFDGKHWLVWSGTMESYLEHQGISYVLTETAPTEVKATDNIPPADIVSAAKIWAHLKTQYGGAQCADLYAYFQTALNAKYNVGLHPDPQLLVITTAFARLENESLSIPEFLRAMIILNIARIPSVTETVLQTYEKDKIKVSAVRDALLTHFAQKQSQSQNHVAKFNTKRKRDDPSFTNQQQGSGSAPDKGDKADGKKKNRRGKRSGKNKDNKGKGKADHSHVHGVSEITGSLTIGSIASLTPSIPAPTISHVTHISRDGPTQNPRGSREVSR
ncbi:unnamed protein product [Mycena citricolor]|uniref:Uncharacterized protein n=1 Tax=Mycena citricolor TaxID=2018698 RepID=A0AAD2HH34_9AGAR|nr:unnamed protein product [Mycena citricolor]